MLAGVARAVGVELAGTGPPLEALVEFFGDDRWLLILDNLEQVVDAARDIDALLARCPGVVMLATSRTVLGLRAEREYPVPPLPLPADPTGVPTAELAASPAVALFVDRARAARPDFALTERNAAAVAEICRRLDGLPLAIELAAARTRLLDPDALLRRLARSLDALGAGAVDLPERQRTLRATVEWSVDLLDDAERSLLETAAVFVDGWTAEAAAQVAGLDEDEALDRFEALARHSLVHLDPADGGSRLRMLETIRAFLAERLAARPDAAEIRRRHAGYYRELAEQADRPLRGAGQRGWAGAWTPRRATWPPPSAGTSTTTPGRCRTCSGSSGSSGSCGTIWARPAPGSTSCCPPPTPSTTVARSSWRRRRPRPASRWATTGWRWRPASAWRRCSTGSRTRTSAPWPGWSWPGPTASSATSTALSAGRRSPWSSSGSRTSRSGPRSPRTPPAWWR